PHVSSGVRSAGCNLIATLVVGMSETIAITGKSVKLFKGHYTSYSLGSLVGSNNSFYGTESMNVSFVNWSAFAFTIPR
ncbi:MAG: hypothetical protein ACREYE_20505, partial [Gammaproteobacteria bacterium]